MTNPSGAHRAKPSEARVLFYGSYPASLERRAEVEGFIEALVAELLAVDATLVTRVSDGAEGAAADGHVRVGGVVRASAAAAMEKLRVVPERIVGYASDAGARAEGAGVTYVLPPGEQWAKYRFLLKHCDVVVAIGGEQGTERLGLIALATGTPFLPVPYANGSARRLWTDLVHGQDRATWDPSILELLSRLEPPDAADIRRLAAAIVAAPKGKAGVRSGASELRPEAITLSQLWGDLTLGQVCKVVGVVLGAATALVTATWRAHEWLKPGDGRNCAQISVPVQRDALRTQPAASVAGYESVRTESPRGRE